MMNIIDICYTACRLGHQTIAPALPGFQGISRCLQYLYNHPHKTIFYTYNPCEGYNIIKLKWIGDQVEDCTTQNCLEFRQFTYHARILNRRRTLSGIIHTLLGISVFWIVQI